MGKQRILVQNERYTRGLYKSNSPLKYELINLLLFIIQLIFTSYNDSVVRI